MKKRRELFFSSIVVIAILSLISCYSTTKVSDQNIVDIYKNDLHSLHPEFRLVHVNDSLSQVYYKINESELLYERKALSDSFSASVRIFCRLTLNYESPLVMDSNSVVLNLQSTTNTRQEYTVGSIPIKINKGNRYLLTITAYDMNSKRTETTYMDADKTDWMGSQNFLVHDQANGHLLFSLVFDTDMRINIQYQHPAKKLYVRIYKNKFPIAAPPFSADEYNSPQLFADSSFSIHIKNGMFPLTLQSKGMYHIMVDSNDLGGLTLFRFDGGYPNISMAYELAPPLRYISSNDEFEKFTRSTNPKQDVDIFLD